MIFCYGRLHVACSGEAYLSPYLTILRLHNCCHLHFLFLKCWSKVVQRVCVLTVEVQCLISLFILSKAAETISSTFLWLNSFGFFFSLGCLCSSQDLHCFQTLMSCTWHLPLGIERCSFENKGRLGTRSWVNFPKGCWRENSCRLPFQFIKQGG